MNKNNNQIIQVKNLGKRFKDLKAVDDISFSVQKGEIFAFLGPNGAGKSTTIKMMTTLLSPTKGKIFIAGVDAIREKNAARKNFGIVFQDPSLDDDLTAWENMDFHGVLYKIPRSLRKQRVSELLEFVGLSERKNSLVKTFSGGMKRRLEIARGLLHHPQVLFLDEPTLGLDPQTRNHIWEYIENLNKKEGITVFFTTHYMNEAEKIAQKIAIIDGGRIISSGTLKQILKDTKTDNLEDAFLKLTGKDIREEDTSAIDRMRERRRRGR